MLWQSKSTQQISADLTGDRAVIKTIEDKKGYYFNSGRIRETKEKEKPEANLIKLSGEVRLGLGFTSDDVIWKDANADRIECPGKRTGVISGDMRHNTYDAKIYDRLNLVMESRFDSPFNILLDFTLDPWTFIGKSCGYYFNRRRRCCGYGFKILVSR